MTLGAMNGVSGNDNNIKALKNFPFQMPVTFLHQSSCPVSLDAVSYFLAGQKCGPVETQLVLPAKNHHIPVTNRFPLIVKGAEITLSA